MLFDLLIQGGEVVDPTAGFGGQMDVAIKRNRIATVEPRIPASAAVQVIDAHGQYVTPGLIDLHTHVYRGATYWGINPDPIAARSGVSTWIDAGSAGAFNLTGLRDSVIERSQARIYAFINISGIGLTGATGELANLEYCDVDACCRTINLHHDVVLGVKARIDRCSVGTNGLEPFRRALTVAEKVGRPVMVHIGDAPPSIEEVLELVRPKDILTHCFTGRSMSIVDDSGALLHAAKRAWDSGIVMDIGHGSGSFSFATAEKLGKAGYWPDVISTDIHQISVLGPMFDLPTCLSKFMALGMSLPEVIQAATGRPAEVIGLKHELGTLRPGALADVALFRLHQGQFPFYDVDMQMREGNSLLRNTITIINGHPISAQLEEQPAPWIALTEEQRALIARGHTPAALASTARRSLPGVTSPHCLYQCE